MARSEITYASWLIGFQFTCTSERMKKAGVQSRNLPSSQSETATNGASLLTSVIVNVKRSGASHWPFNAAIGALPVVPICVSSICSSVDLLNWNWFCDFTRGAESSASIVWHCSDMYAVFVCVFLMLPQAGECRECCSVCGGIQIYSKIFCSFRNNCTGKNIKHQLQKNQPKYISARSATQFGACHDKKIC